MAEMRVLLTEEQIKERVKELGNEISRDFAGEELLVVGVLKGAFVFLADLVRHINLPLQIDFMDLSSYGLTTESSGEVRILMILNSRLRGKCSDCRRHSRYRLYFKIH